MNRYMLGGTHTYIMELDYAFIVEIFSRYAKHLEGVISGIEKNITQYKFGEEKLIRLAEYKPEEYTKELEKMRFKIQEADLKLSHVVPRRDRMITTITQICGEQNIPLPSFLDKDDAWTGK